MPRRLKAAGYATGMFGKCTLVNRGLIILANAGSIEAIVSAGKHFDFATKPQTDYPDGQYPCRLLTDKAVDFIHVTSMNRFFLYLPHFGVHSPFEARPELIEKFKSKATVGGHNSATYAAMIASVDESVGRVMQTLDELKLTVITVLIFTSDNGGVGGYNRRTVSSVIQGWNARERKPQPMMLTVAASPTMRHCAAAKAVVYEGGTREPFLSSAGRALPNRVQPATCPRFTWISIQPCSRSRAHPTTTSTRW